LGEEAHSLGLVTQLAEPDAVLDSALAYATDIADNCSPTSMSVIKRQVHQALNTTFEAAFEDADAEMRESFLRPDVKEGVDSYLEGRAPAFPALEPR